MDLYLYDIKDDIIKKINESEIDSIFDKIYFLDMRIPDVNNIKQTTHKLNKKKSLNENEKKILIFFKSDEPNKLINNIKNDISKIEHKLPLYDIYTENIYLINKYNVYDRVTYQHYRFPDDELIDDIKNKYSNLKETLTDTSDNIEMRKLRKMNLMIDFMKNFNIEILYDTYIKIFYKYSNFVGKEITTCRNQSFIPQFFHIKPYFTRSEIINLALNFEIEVPSKYLEHDEIVILCKKLKKYHITSNMLLKHQNYIINNGNLGLVQYYTLQGSFFMNQYLRNMTYYSSKNTYLEKLIEPMWDLVLNSPEFDKSYYLYRFVHEDAYLKGIKIGDVFIEKGFMSTTRDPFYRSDLYKFGFILLKIKIPAGKKGIGLCLETISHFPEEQEVIFPPNTHFKLIKRDENASYYHTDPHYSSKIKTRYEFEWIENEKISFSRKISDIITKNVDFLNIVKSRSLTLSENIKYFESKFVNELYQFNTTIGDKDLTLMTERYDSSGAYKKFYALELNNGFSIYTIYKGFILFFIEIGETHEGRQMHINYYVKYSSIDPDQIIGDDNLIKFFSSIAYYFDIPAVILYANYLNCDIHTSDIKTGTGQRGFVKHNKDDDANQPITKEICIMGGSYCVDFYQYFKHNNKKYSNINILNVELQPKFSYYDLDTLKHTDPVNILSKTDRDELYQIYFKSYKTIFTDDKYDTISQFFMWLKENKCYLIDQFVVKIDKLLGVDNPFRNDMYMLDPMTYLYNRKLIRTYPMHVDIEITLKRNVLKENKSDYRTR